MPRSPTKSSATSKKEVVTVFTDSEDDDESFLSNMPMPLPPLVVRKSSSSTLHETQQEKNVCHSHSKNTDNVHQQSQQRKRPAVTSSHSTSIPAATRPISSSASCVGGRKAAPLSPLNKQGQSHVMKSGKGSEFEDVYNSGAHVNQMLSKLGADLQLKVRAKRQRLEEYFKGVKTGPGVTLASRQRHMEQRQKLIDELKTDSTKVSDRLDNINLAQEANFEKHAKMMQSLTRGTEQVRNAISECAKAQVTVFEKFVLELKKLEELQEKGTTELMERCESTLIDLQNKIASEQMKSETDSLFKLKFI